VHPFDAVQWEVREALIANESGEIIFQQKDVEVPTFWSQTATNVVVSKYFRGQLETPERETSICFNSPVWFNVGIEPHPQCSACFINAVEDTMESILDLAKTEGMLFKYGSGTGSNLSTLRSCKEILAGGGMASGPVSFMKGFDAFAGVIKSGGKTRRAAKMVILGAASSIRISSTSSTASRSKSAKPGH
jgi:ribonucleoside-diphosphate reductase alpha chain